MILVVVEVEFADDDETAALVVFVSCAIFGCRDFGIRSGRADRNEFFWLLRES